MNQNRNEINGNDKSPTERWEDESFEEKPKIKHTGFYAIGIAFCILIYACCQNCNSPQNVTKPAEEYVKPIAQSVDIIELYNAYENNEVRADGIYKGKFIAICGRVGEIGKDFTDQPFINFKMDRYGINNVHCFFANSSGLAKLNKSDNVCIEGICAGKIMGDVIMNNCALQ